jgi:proline iminopeptidase
LLYAERYPHSVRKLILLTHWLSGYDDSAEWNRFIEECRGNPVYENAIACIEGPTPDSQAEWYQYMLNEIPFYVADPPRHFPIFADAMGEPSRWTYKAQKASNNKKGITVYSDLDKVQGKTLCLGCEEDPVCSAKVTGITHDGIASSELAVIDDCGHFPWIEKPVQFFAEVVRFFKD